MSDNLVSAHLDRSNSIGVQFPNVTIIYSTHAGMLPNTKLPRYSRTLHLFPGLHKVLLSSGQLCDACMRIILTKHKLLEVMDDKSQEIMLQVSRSTIDGMCHVNLSNESETRDRDFKNQANSCNIACNKTKKSHHTSLCPASSFLSLLDEHETRPLPPSPPTISNCACSRQKF